jgi:transcriptional regulator with XRE-family HTH domain
MGHRNHFSTAFKTIRSARGLTQEDFVGSSGRTYISELERALKHPTLNKIDELVGPLEVHPLTALFLSYLTNESSLKGADSLWAEVRGELAAILEARSASQ